MATPFASFDNWAYPGFVDGLIVGSGGANRLTLFKLHG